MLVSGYLDLAIYLKKNKKINGHSFNFSSNKIKNIRVVQFLTKIRDYWPNIGWKTIKKKKFYESSLLQLDNSKAKKLIKWESKLNLNLTITFVVDWYVNFKKDKKNTYNITKNQILKFMELSK